MHLKLFIFFIVYSSIHLICSSTLPSPELHMKYGGEALNALQRLLAFFESDVDDLNLDGVYGLRISQGQLNALHDILTSTSNDKQHLTDKNNHIQSLSIQIERISNKSLVAIARDATAYLQRFILVASKPFMIDYEVREIDDNLIEHGERISDFNEEESDVCFAELLGSSNRPNSTQCFVSQTCWNMMTSSLSKDYRLTHQLLWFLIAKNIGCIDNRPVSNLANKNFKSLEDRYCSNIYQDAKINFNNNDNQDLFLEEVLLCSILGYEEFLRLDWFSTILSWQDEESGCYNRASESMESYVKTKRHLLIEQEMNNGCLSHKSGLASGVLATYARAFLQ
ncbi:unnamed protein product [Adineta steineri]|uniref:Uncharacterized protein n=1 Tax=Adineta steineri TaxID=433720 RepID=A0A815E8A7_9BILA|nr:unnamed protein product [Adineta steineri]CAF1308237.1 unnamed protein product [Adineta steineri]CAF1578563.1 unnamed protein product [Adineta steineri]CAF1578710.1 unnamed protein product [Adineta steineri]